MASGVRDAIAQGEYRDRFQRFGEAVKRAQFVGQADTEGIANFCLQVARMVFNDEDVEFTVQIFGSKMYGAYTHGMSDTDVQLLVKPRGKVPRYSDIGSVCRRLILQSDEVMSKLRQAGFDAKPVYLNHWGAGRSKDTLSFSILGRTVDFRFDIGTDPACSPGPASS